MRKHLMMVPLVVAQRTPLLWLEMVGLSTGPRESERMVKEKFAAAAEGAMAVQVEMQRLWWTSALAIWQGGSPPTLMQSGARLADAALRPAARRVRANVRRLSAPR